jgi:phosphoglycerate dehydrogenase-like enzyme
MPEYVGKNMKRLAGDKMGSTGKILIFSNAADRYREEIKRKLPDIELYVAYGSKEMPIEPSEVSILLAWLIKPELLRKMTSLKWIQSLGAGVDPFFKESEIINNIILTRSVANLPRLMAQYATGVVIGDNIGFEKHRANQAAKNWAWEPFFDISRKTVVVIGTGSIGSEIAKSLKFFKIEVIGVNRRGRAADGFDRIFPIMEIDAALSLADYLILVVPLTPETRGMIDLGRIGKMKKDALLCNIARGAVVVEKDLIEALDKGLLRRAVLDVFEREPLPAESPLWIHPLVTVTPHIAGISDVELVAEEFVQNYKKYIKGEALSNMVDKKRQY